MQQPLIEKILLERIGENGQTEKCQ